jgi:hypothetical protein
MVISTWYDMGLFLWYAGDVYFWQNSRRMAMGISYFSIADSLSPKYFCLLTERFCWMCLSSEWFIGVPALVDLFETESVRGKRWRNPWKEILILAVSEFKLYLICWFHLQSLFVILNGSGGKNEKFTPSCDEMNVHANCEIMEPAYCNVSFIQIRIRLTIKNDWF